MSSAKTLLVSAVLSFASLATAATVTCGASPCDCTALGAAGDTIRYTGSAGSAAVNFFNDCSAKHIELDAVTAATEIQFQSSTNAYKSIVLNDVAAENIVFTGAVTLDSFALTASTLSKTAGCVASIHFPSSLTGSSGAATFAISSTSITCVNNPGYARNLLFQGAVSSFATMTLSGPGTWAVTSGGSGYAINVMFDTASSIASVNAFTIDNGLAMTADSTASSNYAINAYFTDTGATTGLAVAITAALVATSGGSSWARNVRFLGALTTPSFAVSGSTLTATGGTLSFGFHFDGALTGSSAAATFTITGTSLGCTCAAGSAVSVSLGGAVSTFASLTKGDV